MLMEDKNGERDGDEGDDVDADDEIVDIDRIDGGSIAHLAETPFGFSTSTLLPITPQTPKHLGFGVIMPFRVRRDTPFGLKTPASWRNGFFDSELFDLRYPANGFFNFQWSYFSAVQVKTNAP